MKHFLLFVLIWISSCTIFSHEERSYNYIDQELTRIPEVVFTDKTVALRFGVSLAFIDPLGNHYAQKQNKITALPNEICSLKRLKILDLSFNNLQSLPTCFHKLQKLESLDLSFNQSLDMKIVIEQVVQMRNLKRLNLYGIPSAYLDSTRIRSILKSQTIKLIITQADLTSLLDKPSQ